MAVLMLPRCILLSPGLEGLTISKLTDCLGGFAPEPNALYYLFFSAISGGTLFFFF